MDSSKNNLKNEINIFSKKIVKISEEKEYYGRLNDPSCAAFIKGICGDEMEYYLVIKDEIIIDVKFWTTGCVASRACGIVLAKKIFNKNIYQALSISPKLILDELLELPREYYHCSVLACLTFYKAIGEYIVAK